MTVQNRRKKPNLTDLVCPFSSSECKTIISWSLNLFLKYAHDLKQDISSVFICNIQLSNLLKLKKIINLVDNNKFILNI